MILTAAAALTAAVCVYADDEPKFTVTPSGQLALDGAVYCSPTKELFPDGVSIPEVRLGVKLNYGKWSGHIQVGYAYEKVGLKDIWLQYTWDERNSIRIGSFIHQMGLDSSYGALTKPTMNAPVSNAIFDDVRHLGFQYVYSAPKWYATFSAHGEPNNTKLMLRPDQMTKTGVGVRTRLVARPVHQDGVIVQAGVSGAFSTPQYGGSPDTHDSFTFGTNWPTKVAQVQAMSCTVGDARNLFKLTPELLLCYHRVALQSQYYFMQVNRKYDFTRYQAQGAYVTLRGLILGKEYPYAMQTANIPTGAPKSLEAVVSYNYTTLSDAGAAIYGGRINQAMVTLNYYINKYMTARLNYTYSYVWDTTLRPATNMNGVMVRLQAVF